VVMIYPRCPGLLKVFRKSSRGWVPDRIRATTTDVIA
jgi:hypothetical protein